MIYGKRETVEAQSKQQCFLLYPLQPMRIVYMGLGPMDCPSVTLVFLLSTTMVRLTPAAALAFFVSGIRGSWHGGALWPLEVWGMQLFGVCEASERVTVIISLCTVSSVVVVVVVVVVMMLLIWDVV